MRTKSKENVRTQKRSHGRGTNERYTEAQKLQAVTILCSTGRNGPLSYEAMQAARSYLNANIATGTFGRWVTQYRDIVEKSHPELVPRPVDVSALVAETQDNIIKEFAEVRHKALQHLNKDTVIDAMSGRDAGVVVGIMNDHLIKMIGLSTDEQTAVKQLRLACTRANMDLITVLNDLTNVINQSGNSPQDNGIVIDSK